MKNLVKQFLYPLLLCCLFLSCDKEEELAPVATESATATLNSGGANPCPNCKTEILRKTVGKEEQVGTLEVCQTKTNELTITFRINNDRPNAWFSQTGYAIFANAPTSLNPGDLDKESTHGDKPRTVTYTVDLSSFGFTSYPKDIYIAALAVVSGPDGAGGQVWAGTLRPTQGNPNSRYFKFTLIKCEKPKECPKIPCLYPKEYWCKPYVKWPCEKIKVGAYEYTPEEVRAIYASAGTSDAKEAFIQAATLQLNLIKYPHLKELLLKLCDPKNPCYKPGDPCCKLLYHLKCIRDYFDKCKVKATPYNICNPKYFPPNDGIKKAAYYIHECLKKHACPEPK
jgi:hypothetical protein